MGTVGLSFGSPTGGTGFDVSATVATIVGNLRNVETPWKSQLTSLQSQDTVISSLGTLFSKLSNDVSSLTNLTGIMAQKTGSSSDTNALQLLAASSSSVAGNHTVVVTNLATTSSGYLTPITNASDTLSGSITLQVGPDGKAQTIDVPSSNKTLAGLAAAINSSGVGVSASVLTDSSGSRLSLVSGTSGKNGTVIVDSASNSIVDTTNSDTSLAYHVSPVVPADAQLTVDGNSLTSSSNTVTNLIPGLTFQLLAPSTKESDGTLEQIQVVIGNDNTTVENAINSMVNDYNSLITAMNVQGGNDSSGNPEPLFGSPTLSLLQQQLLGSLNFQNPNGNLDSIATNTNTTLAGSISIAVGPGRTQTIVIGNAVDPPPADTFYTGSGSGFNTLQGLADTINAAAAGTQMNYSGTAGTDSVASSGTLTSIPDSGLPLSGFVSIQVGTGTTETFVIGSAPNTGAAPNTLYTGDAIIRLSDLADAINTADIGVQATVTTPAGGVSTLSFTSKTLGTDGTLNVSSGLAAAGIGVGANVVTNSSGASLSLLSQTAGASGTLTTKSNIAATSGTLLNFTTAPGTSTANSTGGLTPVADASDVLTGSVTIRVGNGATQTVSLPAGGGTLSDLSDAINSAKVGVTASVGTTASGLPILTVRSSTAGSSGTLNLTSSILDTTSTSTKTLNYTNSSDVSGLSNLGITMSTNYDGTITFDPSVLTSALNSDYSGVLGFFQNVNSWGQTFSTILSNAGTSSSKGSLALAAKANSTTESMLNANISREESLISIQQTSLNAELISANQIMQSIPSQLEGINQLYSAITGYNQNH